MLDGRRIEEFFSPRFFKTEFWLLWSTIMGSLPQHSVIEFRRYMNRFIYLFPDLSTMAGVMRTPFNQHEAFVKPLVAWLSCTRRELSDRRLRSGTLTSRLSPGRMTVNRLDYEQGGRDDLGRCRPDDIVLVTTGSQAADYSAGSMTEAPKPQRHWTVMGAVEAPGAGAQGFRRSGHVLRRPSDRRFALGDCSRSPRRARNSSSR